MGEAMGRELTLIVETPNGVYARLIPDATPLMAGTRRGPAAEDATRSAVARWGMPDFVYRPVIRHVGSGTRELGDGILLVGNRAVVVQVKSRETPSDDDASETAWVTKNAAKALSQARGTIRQLRSSPAALTNLRSRQITIDGSKYDWLAAVVLDHPGPAEDMTVTNPFSDLRAVVLLRRDWEFLFEQLKSTYAVVSYLERVAGEEPVPLGEEPVRYYQLAQADEDAPPSQVNPAVAGAGRVVLAPLLPKAPAGQSDRQAHALLRIIMEDIATSPVSDAVTEINRIQVLSEIDHLPVAHRTELGQALLKMMRDVMTASPEDTKWAFRSFRFAPGTPHLAFGACNKFSELHLEAFRQWTMLRHTEAARSLGDEEGLVTVAILLTPRSNGQRPWDTSMFRAIGDLDLSAEELAGMRRFWSRQPGAQRAPSAGETFTSDPVG